MARSPSARTSTVSAKVSQATFTQLELHAILRQTTVSQLVYEAIMGAALPHVALPAEAPPPPTPLTMDDI